MKNRLIISFLFSCILIAAPVEIDKAERVAESIFIERSNTGIREDFSVRSVDIIKDELSTALGLVGLTDIKDISSDIIAERFIRDFKY